MTITPQYVQQSVLLSEDLDDNPIQQFTAWLGEAARGSVSQPLAASLASVGADGRPLARTVLLKYYDKDGFVFFTHLGSRKVKQIAENPNVSLLFAWLSQNRQIHVTGRAERLAAVEAIKSFLLGENNGVTVRAAVEMQLAELKQRLDSGVQSPGTSWGGYRIVPDTIEFFQGRGTREHDRFLYQHNETCGMWKISPLD